MATKLLHKITLSSAISIAKALDNGNNYKFIYGLNKSEALNYSFSFGKLMLPKQYRDYRQTNINLMVETLSQFNTGSGKYYLDIALSVQLIFNSESRINIGYRKQVSSNLLRTEPNDFLSGQSMISLILYKQSLFNPFVLPFHLKGFFVR